MRSSIVISAVTVAATCVIGVAQADLAWHDTEAAGNGSSSTDLAWDLGDGYNGAFSTDGASGVFADDLYINGFFTLDVATLFDYAIGFSTPSESMILRDSDYNILHWWSIYGPSGSFELAAGDYQLTGSFYASGDYSLVGTPTEVPAPGPLAVLGLAGLAGRRRRR